jgi:hypothetical protein
MQTIWLLLLFQRHIENFVGGIGHPMSQTIISSIKKRDAVILEITKFYATWDHGKVKK